MLRNIVIGAWNLLLQKLIKQKLISSQKWFVLDFIGFVLRKVNKILTFFHKICYT